MTLYDKEEQLAHSSKLGLISVPLKALLDVDGVFDGRRTCLLDYIAYASETGVDEATHVVYLAKKGADSTNEGWGCEYLRKCKVAELPKREDLEDDNPSAPTVPIRKQRIVIPQDRTRPGVSSRVFPHITTRAGEADLASELSGEDYEDELIDSWVAEYESDAKPERRPSESKQWRRMFHMKHDGRADIPKSAARVVDTSNYVIFVSATENHLPIIWKERGRRKFTNRQRDAQSKLKHMTQDVDRLIISRL